MRKYETYGKPRKHSVGGVLCTQHLSDPMNSHACLEPVLELFIEGSSFLPKRLPFSKDYLANTALSSINQICYSEI